MNNIINHLFIGAFEDAYDVKQIKDNNIKYIINVAEECNHKEFMTNITYYKFDIIEYFQNVSEKNPHDLNHANLEKVFALLDKYINSGENVLIHCAHGMSRSVSFVIYYLIKKYNINTKDALAYIKSKRSIAHPCHSYMKYLAHYDK